MFGAMTYLHPGQDIFNAFLSFAGFHLKIDERQFNIFINIKLIYKVKALKDKTDITFSEHCPVAFFQIGHLCSIEDITSWRWIVKQSQDIKEGWFTTTWRAHNSHIFSFFYFQIHFIESSSLNFFSSEDFG